MANPTGNKPLTHITHWKIPALYGVNFSTHKDGSVQLMFERGREDEVATHLTSAIDYYRMRGAQVPAAPALPEVPAWTAVDDDTEDMEGDTSPHVQ